MGYVFAIEPINFTAFVTGEDELEKCQEWGLLSDKAAKTKKFNYKRAGQTLDCSIVGFVDLITAVIEFGNGQRHCIHPSYLKEMQSSGFGQRATADNLSEAGARIASESLDATGMDKSEKEVKPTSNAQTAQQDQPVQQNQPAQPKEQPPAKEKKRQKIQLPEEKVKMTATVKEFAKVPNHFTEEDDEVVVYDEVAILEPETEIGTAWSSFSATLKKLELAVGDKLVFDAKIAAKKLLKHPVPYKINNPSKIQKEQ